MLMPNEVRHSCWSVFPRSVHAIYRPSLYIVSANCFKKYIHSLFLIVSCSFGSFIIAFSV